ncbi:hemagglutinin repeat-containing protein [Thauera sp.]|uniref:hemagglutinin repeat-containing protein n=1 Tax=Thauera sp. TaxID=1905334 RepID=UPI0039E5780D
MNSRRYRLVFNRLRGMFMAVAETAIAQGRTGRGSAGATPPAPASLVLVRLRPAAFALLLALGGIPLGGIPLAQAQIVAYKPAPGGQQPTVLNATNGVPVVNIQTPSAAGVSRNSYAQFDVQAQGAILNNSRGNVQSQLGGWLQGNPWLAAGDARVILNEVISASPSQLLGYVEVAGRPAQVVIANPAGLTCDGCGFINASRATLTTGTPILNGGQLDGYRVEGGSVRITGAGLDSSGAGYTDIIARAVEANAGLWAQSLKITAGANVVDAGHGQAAPIAGSGEAPRFAIDVAQLGGMYAGKIHLVGTEAGVGVRNAGTLAATAGEVLITTDGQLINRGSVLTGEASLGIQARGVDNAGTLAAGERLALASHGDLINRGLLQAGEELQAEVAGTLGNEGGTLDAQRLDVRADTLDNTGGVLRQSGRQALLVEAARIDNRAGGHIGHIAAARTSSGAGSSTDAENGSSADNSTADTLELPAGSDTAAVRVGTAAPRTLADGRIAVRNQLINAGTLSASGAVALAATQSLDNAGTLNLDRLDASGESLRNQGTIDVARASIGTSTFDNRGGRLAQNGAAPGSITVAGRLDNRGGLLASAASLELSAGEIDNRGGGRITADGDLALDTTRGALDNDGGSISARRRLSAEVAGPLGNERGRIVAGTELALVAAGAIDNTSGTLGAVAGRAGISAGGTASNTAGRIEAATDLVLSSHGLDNSQGTIIARSVSLDSRSQALDNAAGRVIADTALSIDSGRLDNTAGLIQAGAALGIDTHGQALLNHGTADSGGGILARNALTLATGTMDNTHGFIRAGGTLDVASHDITNQNGNIQSAGNLDVRTVGVIDNLGGSFVADGALSLRAGRISGDGRLRSNGDLSFELDADLDNTGEIVTAGDIRMRTAGALTNSGTLRAGDELVLNAASLTNTASGTLAGGTVDISVSGSLSNRGLIDGGETRIQAGTLDNLGSGRIYGDHLAIAAGTLNNLAEGSSAPVIAARERLDLGVGTLLNQDEALIFSAGDLAIGGRLDAHGHASGSADRIDNVSATIEAQHDLAIETTHLVNRKRAFAFERRPSEGTLSPAELLEHIPELAFRWPVPESRILTWRNYIRDRYINVVAKLLGAGPDQALVDAFTFTEEPGESMPIFRPNWRTYHEFTSVWGNLIGYTGPVGGGLLTDAERTRLAAAVDAQPLMLTADSAAIWRAIVDTLTTEYPEHLARMVAAVGPQGATHTAYRTVCVDADDDCSYVDNFTTTRRYQRDAITADSPAAVIRAGGGMAIHAAALDNHYSFIQSGGDMVLAGTALTNIGAELYELTDVTSIKQLWHWSDRNHGSTASAYSTQTQIGSAPGIISAGGTLSGSFTDRIDNLSIRHNAAPVTGPTGSTPAALGPSGQGPAAATGTDRATTASRTAATDAAHPHPADTRLALPTSRLYHVRPDAGAHYLVETDPAFADYRQWLSSDYMLEALGLDPAAIQKRLGDGFYEQRLITEQVAQLTGRRLLPGHADDEAQYRALMNAGLTYADEWQLVPGVALSAEQMARLTSDIVWLVEESVTLADGSTQRVLVPRLYASVRPGDLEPSGALLAADTVRLDTAGELLTSGTIAGRQAVLLTGTDISVERGAVVGRDVAVQASQDLTVLGGQIRAERTLQAGAGRDLRIESTTVDRDYAPEEGRAANAAVQHTAVERVAGLYVTGEGGTLVAAAGRDLSLLAAAVSNAGDGGTRLSAGRDLVLGTVTETSRASTSSKGNRWREDSSTERGTLIDTAGDLALAAGQDIRARAADLSAGGALTASAGRDLDIDAGEATLSTERWRKSSGGSALSRRSRETLDTLDQSTAVASTFSGDTVTLAASNDLGVRGSNVVATGDLALAAGRDLTIEAATETHAETHFRKDKKSGLSSSGASISIGSQKLSQNTDTDATTALGSTVGSVQGDVTLLAGRQYRQVGSDVLAPGGDIDIAAQTVDIVEARESSAYRFEQKASQSGLTLSISNPVVTAVQTARQMKQAASDTRDTRMKALAAASTALAGMNAYDAVMAGQGTTIAGKDGQIATEFNDKGEAIAGRDATAAEKVGGINVAISLGSSSSKSSRTQTTHTAAGSTVQAGGDIRISATGAGEHSDLTLRGAQVSAGGNVTLTADDQIKLLAAENRAEQHSRNRSSSASVGIGFALGGSQNGFTLQLGASQARGEADGSDLTWSHTHIEAGDTLTLIAGGDTTIKGALVQGERVVADIGGRLDIESVQDTHTYDSKQKSAGFSLSLCIPPFCYGATSTGSISMASSRIDSDYASVTTRSGLEAGDKGFDVRVGGDTTLTGAVIASTQQAVDDNLNRFSTGGSLTLTDLENKADYDARGASINIGTGISTNGQLTPQGTSAGFGEDSDSAHSTTTAGISSIAGDTAVRTGDAPTGIAPIFDADTVQKEIDAQVKITQTFNQYAPKAAADFAAARASELRKQGQHEEATLWEEGGAYRIALHAAIGGLSGNVEGALGAGAAAGSALLLDDLQTAIRHALKEAGASDGVADLAGQLISGTTAAGIGAVVSGGSTAGAAMGMSVDANNRQLHPNQIKALQDKAKELDGKDGLTAEQWEQRLTQQLLYQNDSQQQSFGNDLEAESILQQIANTTGIDMDARSTAAYWNHAMNSEFLGQLASSYALAGTPGDMNIDSVIRVMSQAAHDPNMVRQNPQQRKTLFDAMLGIALSLPPESITSSMTEDSNQSQIFTALNRLGNSLLGTGMLTAQEEESVRQRQMQALVMGYGHAIAAAGLGTRNLLGGKANASAQEIIAAERISQLAQEAKTANAKLTKLSDEVGDGPYAVPKHTGPDSFQTHGLKPAQVPLSIRNQLTKDLEEIFGQGALGKVQEVISSGKSIPVPMAAASETKLYRIQMDGYEFNHKSVYYMDAAQLQRVQSNPQLLQDMLGLPPGSKGVSYTVFERQPLPGQTPTVYQSNVATVSIDAGKISVGSGIQTILPNGNLWSKPLPIATIKIGK